MQIKSKYYQRLAVAAQWAHVASGTFSGPMYGAYAHLATAFSSTPNDSTVWADVTEATYDGYAAQALTLPAAEIDTTVAATGICGMQTWVATGSVTPNVVVAIVYTDNAVGGNVLGIDVLADSVPISGTTTGFASVTVVDLAWQTNGVPATIIQ